MMIACAHAHTKKHGRDRHGRQRYRCLMCGKLFADAQAPKLLGDMRLPLEKAMPALSLLLEGNSIRSVERLLRIHRDTICQLVVVAGALCERLMASVVRNVGVEDVQADELWGFVLCKERVKKLRGYGEETGDIYTFLGIERETKLVLAYHLGKRSERDADAFIRKLGTATGGRFQLTTDGLPYYRLAVARHLKGRVDFAQLVKIVGNPKEIDRRTAEGRYSPGAIVQCKKRVRQGNPDMGRVCTSHVERLNLSLRTSMRRLTRLTLGHSKKWANHEAATALYLAWYNWGRVHQTLGKTPAMAAGLTDHPWSIHELLLKAVTC